MQTEPVSILRNLTAADIPAALRLSVEAGWNQTEDDWRLLIELAPQSSLGIEVEGVLASTATLFCYGRKLAWVGMVLTQANFRGRGFAKRLLARALAMADELGIASVKLDATDQGQPIYEKLGFRAEQSVERWELAAASIQSTVEPPPASNFTLTQLAADAIAFGVDRSRLLNRLAQPSSPYTRADSYLLTRVGRVHRYLGPCVANSPDTARRLIEDALHRSPAEGWCWDLLPQNANTVSLARELGFSPRRRLLRMVRGANLRGNENAIYALAGFELG